MTALISGSMAFDTIMVFQDKFANHILSDKTHMLNVCFFVPDMRREFGGCAGNIAYNLNMIGGNGFPMATVGKDFGAYSVWMQNTGVSEKYITQLEDSFTAQAYITTDIDDNQITAFHPGAMSFAHQDKVPTDAGITLGIVAPNGREAMISHAEQFVAANIPFIFDPGQGLPMFSGDELKTFISQATWVICNDYEASLIADKTGLSIDEIKTQVQSYIITKGGQGSDIHTADGVINIPVVTASNVVDPTGCGDAYRAGIIYGLQNELDWQTTGQIASLLGSLKIACPGTQNHRSSAAAFKESYEAAFGSSF